MDLAEEIVLEPEDDLRPLAEPGEDRFLLPELALALPGFDAVRRGQMLRTQSDPIVARDTGRGRSGD